METAAMPDLIWQIGIGADEASCAAGLHKKHGAQVIKITDTDYSFDSLTKNDRLQIVANFSLVTGKIDKNMTAELLAETLVGLGLTAARVISLVICNSAVECEALGRTTLVEKLRDCLIKSARDSKQSLYVGKLCGRTGYVNVYTKTMEDDLDVYFHFVADKRERDVGRKYVHTEPSVGARNNQFIPKGKNKVTISGINVTK